MGRHGLWAYWSIPSIKITYNWYMRRSCLFSICLHFATVCLFYENFWVEKKFSDMVHGFHSDYHEKMQSKIAVHSFLHHIEIHGPCQTLLIFLICFFSLSWRHGPQNNFPWSPTQNEKTRNKNFHKLILNMILTKLLTHKCFNLWYFQQIMNRSILKDFDFNTFDPKNISSRMLLLLWF